MNKILREVEGKKMLPLEWRVSERKDDEIINYHELYKILFEKYKCTHDELHYWILNNHHLKYQNGFLETILVDFPSRIYDNGKILEFDVLNTECKIIYPSYHFYLKSQIYKFNPRMQRFVYLKDLTSLRNWRESNDSMVEILKKANSLQILRLYDKKKNEFTIDRWVSNKDKDIINIPWSETVESEKYFSNPDSFFLIEDILRVERIFFNKSKDSCMQEILSLQEKGLISHPNFDLQFSPSSPSSMNYYRYSSILRENRDN